MLWRIKPMELTLQRMNTKQFKSEWRPKGCMNFSSPDRAEGLLLKVMFRRRQPLGLSQLQDLHAFLTVLCHLLKPETDTPTPYWCPIMLLFSSRRSWHICIRRSILCRFCDVSQVCELLGVSQTFLKTGEIFIIFPFRCVYRWNEASKVCLCIQMTLKLKPQRW